jgi:hypothetical protein
LGKGHDGFAQWEVEMSEWGVLRKETTVKEQRAFARRKGTFQVTWVRIS